MRNIRPTRDIYRVGRFCAQLAPRRSPDLPDPISQRPTVNTQSTLSSFRQISISAASLAAVVALGACTPSLPGASFFGIDNGEEESSSVKQPSPADAERVGLLDDGADSYDLYLLSLTGGEVPGMDFDHFSHTRVPSDPIDTYELSDTPLPQCAKLANLDIADADDATESASTYDEQTKTAVVNLSLDTSLVDQLRNFVTQCGDHEFTLDHSEMMERSARQAGAEISPGYGIFDYDNTVAEIDAAQPEGVEDFYALHIRGTQTHMGREVPISRLQLVGVVNGIFVSAFSSAVLPPSDDPMEIPEIDPANTEASALQGRTEEVFAAQVEILRNATPGSGK